VLSVKKILAISIVFTILFSNFVFAESVFEEVVGIDGNDIIQFVNILDYRYSADVVIGGAERYVRISSVSELVNRFPNWQIGIEIYDETFFEDNFLIFFRYLTPYTTAFEFDVSDVFDSGEFINIEVSRERLDFGFPPLPIPATWTLVLEIDNELSRRGFSIDMEWQSSVNVSPLDISGLISDVLKILPVVTEPRTVMSVEELEDIVSDWSGTLWDWELPNFSNFISTYNETFFENSFLLFVDWIFPVGGGGGEFTFDVLPAFDVGGQINLGVIEVPPTGGSDTAPVNATLVFVIDLYVLERGGTLTILRDGNVERVIALPLSLTTCNCEKHDCCEECCECGDDCDCNQVATPTATPTNRTFTNSVNVTLSTETDGATIHFTTDGTTPTTASTPFTEPIRLTATTTIRAIAVADGMANSEELYVRFTRQTSGIGNGSSGVTTHNITFNTNGGNTIVNQNVAHNGRATRPADPTRAGFTFEGWYSNAALTTAFDFNTQITSNVTLFARWTENQAWEENPFTDVRANDWFYNYVEYVFTNDLMQGISPTEFAPNAPTTRAMAVTILWRLAGEPTANTQNGFYDVAAGTWYANAVQWAAENGVVLGIGENLFAPHVEITREQMAAILWRYSNSPNADGVLSLADTETISYWAVNAVTWAVDNDVLRLRANETIAPQALATRAEIAFAMTRIAD